EDNLWRLEGERRTKPRAIVRFPYSLSLFRQRFSSSRVRRSDLHQPTQIIEPGCQHLKMLRNCDSLRLGTSLAVVLNYFFVISS
ncbi:hypothetical protein LINPERPRIM_LOCUS23942, partial [Linum perenne]